MKGQTASIVMMVLMLALLYFFMIRPQRKKEKEIQNMRNALKVGDEIVTIGGIYGKIVRIKDDRLTIQTGSDRVKMDVTKWAVSNLAAAGAKEGDTAPAPQVKEEKAAEPGDAKPTPRTIKKLGRGEPAPAEAAEETKTSEE